MFIHQALRYYGHLTTESTDLNEAIASYRSFMNVSEDVSIEDLFALPRCGCPDFQVNNGSGSWPVGCHPDWPNNHTFHVYFNFNTQPNHWKSVFEEAWLLVEQAYADIGMVFVKTDNRSEANTIVTWQRGSGWIGLAIVPNNPRCGQTIWAKYDNRYGTSFDRQTLIYQLAYLMAHEFGHNMGLSHSRGGIMNASLSRGVFTPTMWRDDPSYPILKRWFGGESSPPIWSIPQPEQPRQ